MSRWNSSECDSCGAEQTWYLFGPSEVHRPLDRSDIQLCGHALCADCAADHRDCACGPCINCDVATDNPTYEPGSRICDECAELFAAEDACSINNGKVDAA